MMKCTLTWKTIKDGELKAECNPFANIKCNGSFVFFLSALITLVLFQVHKVDDGVCAT